MTYKKSTKVYESSLDGMPRHEDVKELFDDDNMKKNLLVLIVKMSRMRNVLNGHESDIYTASRRYGNMNGGSPTKQGCKLS